MASDTVTVRISLSLSLSERERERSSLAKEGQSRIAFKEPRRTISSPNTGPVLRGVAVKHQKLHKASEIRARHATRGQTHLWALSDAPKGPKPLNS